MTLKRSGRSEHYLNGCKLQRLYDQTMSQIKMKCFQLYSFPCMRCLHFLSGTIQSQNFRKKLITYINHFIESLINYNFTIYKLYSALALVSSTIFTNKLSNRKQPPVGLTPLTRLGLMVVGVQRPLQGEVERGCQYADMVWSLVKTLYLCHELVNSCEWRQTRGSSYRCGNNQHHIVICCLMRIYPHFEK